MDKNLETRPRAGILRKMGPNKKCWSPVECSNVFLRAGNNPGVLKNSTEHAEPLFIAFKQFPQMTSISLRIS